MSWRPTSWRRKATRSPRRSAAAAAAPSSAASTCVRRPRPTPRSPPSRSSTARIDCIVANAGIAHKVPLPVLSDDKWDLTFDIDLKGIFRVVRPALARHEGAQVGRHRLPVVDHGRRLWLGRACPLFGGQVRRRRSGARPRRRAGPRRHPGQRRRAGLHPHRAASVQGAFARARRRRQGRASSFPWAASASPRTLPT